MEFTEEQKEMAIRLSWGAGLFQSYFYGDTSFTEQFKDNFQALVCFFDYYAYSRQGAPSAYPKIAIKALQNKFMSGVKSITIADAKEVWRNYQEIARNEYNNLGVNRKLNPMHSDKGILTKMAKENIVNLASHVKSLIQNNQTKEAHEFVDDIRGIGTKIASLYLRDIAYLGKIPENTIKDSYYLQPVDTWIEQAISIIFGQGKPRILRKKQEMIVKLCETANVSPIAFNQGAWVLGRQVADDYSTFKQITRGQNVRAIIKEHIEEKKRYVLDVERLLQG